ncbi:MAG: exodeoxyribonuclease VII small subunit [Saprospiraceae bacterium]
MAKKVKHTYESSMQELQLIVQQLQEDDLSLDSLSSKVKEANELIQFCRTKLRNTEEELGTLLDGM